MNRTILLVTAAIVAALLAGASVLLWPTAAANRSPEGAANDSPATATSVPSQKRALASLTAPPFAVLTTSTGTAVQGGIGTHCWFDGQRGVCVDMIGPITNVDPIRLAVGELYTLDFETLQPTSIEQTWIAVGGVTDQVIAGERAWTEPRIQHLDGPPTTPGRYILSLFTRWDGYGDVSYGFYIELQ